MDSTFQRMQQQLQSEAEAYNELVKKINKLVGPRATYLTQLQENEMVASELDRLEDDAVVYKLLGPVLVKQDLQESKTNVKKRIEFIKAEMERIEKQQNEYEKQQEELKTQIMALQETMRRAQQEAVKRATSGSAPAIEAAS